MPSHDHRRERRNSRDPDSDADPAVRRPRRPSETYRRRRGHRATDSTGELLPKRRDRSTGQYDSSANSTPRRSRQTESTSGSGGNPLNTSSLAHLDALNTKKDRKKGLNNYDEAYLQEVRDRELRLEKERRRAEREQRRREREEEEEVRRTEREEEEAREARREERRQRKREEQARAEKLERKERHERAAAHEDEVFRKERRKSRQKEEHVVVEVSDGEAFRNPARIREDWKRKHQKYERIAGDSPKQEKRQKHSKNKKSRVISGPYVEDGRAEKVYRHEKATKSNPFEFFKKHKKWFCKYFPLTACFHRD
jgi:glucan 1,3-beta-glucosidase